MSCQTFGDFLLAIPRGTCEGEMLVCNLDVGMILPDPVENGSRWFERQDDEQMLGLRTAAHCE